MSAVAGKLAWALFAVLWGVIRYRYAHRARRNRPIEERDRVREIVLLTVSLAGYLGVPIIYLATPWLSFADYPFQPPLLGAGVLASAASLWLFWRSHADLGRNFSARLVIRRKHDLVTNGVYRLIRHPMYSSFLLWSLGQALLLPNWMTGLAGLFGFCILYFVRVGREETLMLQTFGDAYRDYMVRTKRILPYVY